MVKIIREGALPPKYAWMGREWRCGNCNTVVEFEEGDARRLNYDDDQKDGESIHSTCPKCSPKSRVWFYVAKKG